MSFIEDYKKYLAVIIGTLAFIIALFLPAKFALGFDIRCQDTDVWTSINWIFLSVGIILLWGSIKAFAKSIQSSISSRLSKNTNRSIGGGGISNPTNGDDD